MSTFRLGDEAQRKLGDAGPYPLRPQANAPSSHVLAPVPLDDSFDALLDAQVRTDVLVRWRKAVQPDPGAISR